MIGRLAVRHAKNDVATVFRVAQFARSDCGHAAAVKPVSDLDFLVASIAQTHQSTAIGRLSIDAYQVDATEVDGVANGCLTGDICSRWDAWLYHTRCNGGDLRGLLRLRLAQLQRA